jgi:hypothetical protein
MPDEPRYARKVITISALDSPNVAYGLRQKELGFRPTGRTPNGDPIVPGVLRYDEYIHRLQTWDKARIEIGVYGRFYEGADQLLYPPDWLDNAHEFHARISQPGYTRPLRRWLGIDVGEGGDETVWTIIDRLGVLYEQGERTPDTSVIPKRTRDLMRMYRVHAHDVGFDRGGGKTHADALRQLGFAVRTVAFGARPGYAQWDEADENGDPDPVVARHLLELRAIYKNRRAQMYWEASSLFDPARSIAPGLATEAGEVPPTPDDAYSRGRLASADGFGLPPDLLQLRKQLAAMPKLRYDNGEERAWLPPKNKKDSDSPTRTLTEILGCSPDRADAFVIAAHLMIGAELEAGPAVILASDITNRVFHNGNKRPLPPGETVGPYEGVRFAKAGEPIVLDTSFLHANAHTNGNGKNGKH